LPAGRITVLIRHIIRSTGASAPPTAYPQLFGGREARLAGGQCAKGNRTALGIVNDTGVIVKGEGEAFAGYRPALTEYPNPPVTGEITTAKHKGPWRR